MIKTVKLFLLIFLLYINSTISAEHNINLLNKVDQIDSFSFGSCNDQNDPQPLWKYITETKSDLWIWLGDNIYADTKDPVILENSYRDQENIKSYQDFLKTTPIIGTWDDHDFGYDNAYHDNPLKNLSQALFLEFIKEPYKSKRWIQEGVYTAKSFGPKGRRVKFILLDNRFFHHKKKEKKDILGSEQWAWLENQFKFNDADIIFIGSGLSVFAPRLPVTEEWRDHKKAYKKMTGLLNKYKDIPTVVLSGDKHFASIFKDKTKKHLEFMSSGMTHGTPKAIRPLLKLKFPSPFFGLNYGHVRIHWNKKPLEITMTVRGLSEKPFRTRKFRFKGNQWLSINRSLKL